MGTIPALQPFQAPQNQVNLGDTYVQMARMKAYQQQARLDELKLGQEQRQEDRSRLWEQYMGEVYAPQAPESGLAAPPPQQQAPAPAGGLAMAQAGPQAQTPQGPPQGYSGPPSLAAAAPSFDAPLPQPPPPPPQAGAGLATAQAPAPQAPAPGGLGQGTGTRSPFAGLLQPINEQALVRAHRIDPERTEKWYGGLVKMQGDKLEQAKKQNSMVYDVLKAVDASGDPAGMWPEAVKALRAKGIPVPKELETYNPAMLKFKLNEHRTADVAVKEAEEKWRLQQARTDELLGIKHEAETGRIRQQTTLDVREQGRKERETTSQIGLHGAQSEQARATAQHQLASAAREKIQAGLLPKAEERAALNDEEERAGKAQTRQFQAAEEAYKVQTRPLTLKEQELKNRREQVTLDTTLSKEQRDAELHKIDLAQKDVDLQRSKVTAPEYVKGHPKYNANLWQVQQERGETGVPTAEAQQLARERYVADEIAPSAAQGKAAAAVKLREPIVLDAVQKGQIGEKMSDTLDDIEELAYDGALTSNLRDRFRMIAQTIGKDPNDMTAAREWAIRNLGESLTMDKLGGKLGGQISDSDAKRAADAAMAFDRAQTPAQRKVALRILREIADRNMEQGNRHIRDNEDLKGIPKFGQIREERRAKEITREKLDRAIAAKPEWKGRENEAIEWYRQNGFRVRID